MPAGALTDFGACSDCGTIQAGVAAVRGERSRCRTCRAGLERGAGKSLNAALAWSSAGLMLLIPANTMIFLTTSVLGVERHSLLVSSASDMIVQGAPVVGLAVGAFVVVLPILRFALLTAVLGAVKFGYRPPWLGRGFRWACALQAWAMPEVFLLGLWVAYARLAATVDVHAGPGAMAFILAGLCSLFTRAALPKPEVWRAIGPGTPPGLAGDGAAIACLSCDRLAPADQAGRPCPRCGARLHARKPDAMPRALALTAAGLLLYLPANIYPMATLPIGLKPTPYTVIQGVEDLAQAHLWGLALLVLTASFAIPILKLVGLSWCMLSVIRRSDRHLRLKTGVYNVVHEIGRWSMVDPFVISCFVPVTQFNALISSRIGPAAPAFTGVVLLTMLAANAFDPRLMWDAAARRAPATERTP